MDTNYQNERTQYEGTQYENMQYEDTQYEESQAPEEVASEEAADEQLKTQKKRITGNLAHELRTPVTSIRGYLETLVDNPQMDEAKKGQFIDRAYRQTLRLSDLIRDISLITKMEEAPQTLKKEHLGMRHLTCEVI